MTLTWRRKNSRNSQPRASHGTTYESTRFSATILGFILLSLVIFKLKHQSVLTMSQSLASVSGGAYAQDGKRLLFEYLDEAKAWDPVALLVVARLASLDLAARAATLQRSFFHVNGDSFRC